MKPQILANRILLEGEKLETSLLFPFVVSKNFLTANILAGPIGRVAKKPEKVPKKKGTKKIVYIF